MSSWYPSKYSIYDLKCLLHFVHHISIKSIEILALRGMEDIQHIFQEKSGIHEIVLNTENKSSSQATDDILKEGT